MRRPTLLRLTLLAVAAVAIGVSLGFGSTDGDQGPGLQADATLAATTYEQGSLAAVVRSETDRAGSVWARRNVVSVGSFLFVSIVVSGLALDAAKRARRTVAAQPRRASVVPLRTSVGLRAPPQALVFTPIA